jgi:alkylation response protein AidB-like acyl-CoA dehydrogenase
MVLLLVISQAVARGEAGMNLEPTDEQKAITGVLRELADDLIRPAARACEEAGRVSEEIEHQLREMGVAAPVPEELGGQGTFDARTSVMIAEEVARGDPGVAFSVLGGGLVPTLVDLVGTSAQREELLPPLAAGAQGAFLLAERDAGADFTRLESSAIPHGEGRLLIGTKYGVVGADGHGPRIAVARAAGSGDPGGALGLWLVPASADLVAQPEDKLGLRSARTFKVMLDGTPAGELLGGSGADPRRVTLALLRAKLLSAGVALGLARAALEYATAYAKERTAFGKPIGAFQAIAFRIADRAMDIDTARLLTWKAAWAVDLARDDADRAVFSACTQAVSAAVATADDAVQVLGGHGYMRDHPVELWYRDALTLATFDSPSMVGDLFLARAFEVPATMPVGPVWGEAVR